MISVLTNYSVSQFGADFSKWTKTPTGAKNFVEVGIHFFDWMAKFGIYREKAEYASSKLNPASQAVSIIGVVNFSNRLRNRLSDGISNLFTKDSFDDVALVIKDGAVVVSLLRGRTKSMDALFWGAFGAYSAVDFLYSTTPAFYRSKADRVHDDANKSELRKKIYESKANLAYLQYGQKIAVVAMAALSLSSIAFTSSEYPAVMLALSTSNLALKIITHFCGKMIEHNKSLLTNVDEKE